MGWRAGEAIVRRDVWRGRPWVGIAALVVRDEPELLALYVPEGAEIAVAEGDFPIVHPWSRRTSWQGHGIVALHRPGDAYSVWLFWDGPDRRFWGWYLNLEEPFRRTEVGIDSRDNELDLWSEDGRTWHWKDDELLDQRVAEGLYSEAEAASIRAEGERLHAEVIDGGGWWDEAWSDWEPPDDWKPPRLPPGWQR